MSTKKLKECSDSIEQKLLGEALSLGSAIAALRDLYGLTQAELASKVGMSKQNICDIEKSRRFVSPAKAALIARRLGHPESYFIKLALQDTVTQSGLKYKVFIKAVA